MKETFNSEATKQAVSQATTEIQEICSEFKTTSEKVVSELSKSGAALSGKSGAEAYAAFENVSVPAMEDFQKQIDTFMGRVDEIVKSNIEVAEQTTTIYGG